MPKQIAGPEIERLIQLLAKVPGLGPRSARRAALHLIKKKEQLLEPLALAMAEARDHVRVCSVCGNVDTSDPCTICTDPRREGGTIIVVEDVSDLWALERSAETNALYHVLGGVLSPLDGVGPDDLTIGKLVSRVAEGRVVGGDPRRQRHRRGPDHGPLHHRPARRHGGEGHPPCPRRAGRRRARLSGRGHNRRRAEVAHGVLRRCRDFEDRFALSCLFRVKEGATANLP